MPKKTNFQQALFSSGCELAPDVIYLGKVGLLTSSNGLKLAYASPNIDFEAVKNLEVRTNSFQDDFQGLFFNTCDLTNFS